jgi:hypothetical protein
MLPAKIFILQVGTRPHLRVDLGRAWQYQLPQPHTAMTESNFNQCSKMMNKHTEDASEALKPVLIK